MGRLASAMQESSGMKVTSRTRTAKEKLKHSKKNHANPWHGIPRTATRYIGTDMQVISKGTDRQCKVLPHAVPRHQKAVMLVEATTNHVWRMYVLERR